MHSKMHVRTFKLAKFFRLYPRAQIQQGGSENGGNGRVERRRKGKEKAEGMTEVRGGRKTWGNSDGGIVPLLLGGIDATEDSRRVP